MAEIEGLEQLKRKLRGLRLKESNVPIYRALTRIGALLQAEIRIQLRRSGLRRQTGDLANSIDFEVRRPSPTNFEVVAGSFGVSYAAIHEFGYRGPQSVPSHVRLQTTSFGRRIPPKQVNVRAHVRQQNIPPRPYVRPAFDRQKARILDILSKAATGGI